MIQNKFFINKIREIIIEGNIFISQKYINVIAYYVVPLILSILFYLIFSDKGLLYEVSKTMGTIGILLLLIILFIKPLSRVFPKLKIFLTMLRFRRQLGIVNFYILLFHGVGLMAALGVFSNNNFIPQPFLLWGLIGLLIMFILYLTSNNFSVRLFKRNWKRLQMIVYIAALAAIIHVVLIGEIVFAILFGIYIIFKVLELRKVVLY